MEKYIHGIGITAGSQMLKWDILNQHIHPRKLQPGDHVNIFINFEAVLRNISMQKNLHDIVNFHKHKMVIELESAILNLMANYRMYFKKEKCIPRVFLYSTTIDFDNQHMSVYNKFYRSYYKNRYVQNPQFKLVGDVLNEIIIPEIKLILLYVPGCYFIETKTFDSSLVPLIISETDSSKNVIVTSDIFDTLYLFNSNFITIYIKRRYSHFNVISDIDGAIQSIIKDESPLDLTIFNSELYYRLLLSIKGSKIRNIRSAKGFGYGKFLKLLKDGINKDIVLRNFESIDSVLELFPDKYHQDIKLAFQCTSLETQHGLLNEVDISEIQSQIVDKVDIPSLESLNNKRFLEFPINLQGLLD